MLRKFASSHARRSFALIAALLLSGCLESLRLPAFAASAAQKKNAPAQTPRRAPVNSPLQYEDKGPLVRIALVTDVTAVTLRSDSGLAVRRSLYEKPVHITGDLSAEVRQPNAAPPNSTTPSSSSGAAAAPAAHRVEITVVKNAQQAKRITDTIRSKYDQTASTTYDNRTGDYRIVTGRFSSKNQANDMATILRGAGYSKARVVPVLAAGKASTTAAKTASGATRPPAYRTQPSARESIDISRLPRGPQLVAFDAETFVSANDKLLIIAPLARAQNDAALLPPTNNERTSGKQPPTTIAKPAPKSGVKQTAAKTTPKTTAKNTKTSAKRPAGKGKSQTTAKAKTPAKSPVKTPTAAYDRRRAYTPIATHPLTVGVGKNHYRGEIHLTLNERGRINVVNVLPLEEYLRGVVPLELSPSIARLEALKAQAVAARSYAIANLGRFRDEGYDLRDDQRSQVYGGFTAEHATTNRAVEETRGVVLLTFDASGKAVPIEALYSAECGGRTENNENVFLSKAIPYLRSVECPLDRDLFTGREMVSNAPIEPLKEPFGHSLARDLSLLATLGFALPNRVSNDYLKGSVERGELQKWAERASRLTRAKAPQATAVRLDNAGNRAPAADTDAFDINHEIALLKSQKRDITRLAGFATLVALATYGEHRESLFLSDAQISYLLAGLGAENLPEAARADVALLIKDGILRLPGDGQINAKTTIQRGHAIETMARAILFNSTAADLNLQTARVLDAATLSAAPANTLVVGSVNTSKSAPNDRRGDALHLRVEPHARLFRVFGDESYAVDRLNLRGNERVNYHLNAAGNIDFLEAEAADVDDARQQGDTQAKWEVPMSREEVARKLARARLDVGDVEDLNVSGFGASRRVIELQVIGSEKTLPLRGQQIRTIFGLKDNPLFIERQRDGRGQTTGFLFTGTGFGHGVGMCQIGAARLAKHGHSYVSILQRYYTGVSVQKVY